MVKSLKNDVISGFILLKYKVADKIYDIKDPYCKICGKLLPYSKGKDGIYYVHTCKHCQPKDNHSSPSKMKSVLGNDIDCEELYKYVSKYRTRKFDTSYEEQSRKGRLAWEKTLRSHPEKISTKLEYYTNKGFSVDVAKEMLTKKQKTFSLEKCIEKYGMEEGVKRWKIRQEKWQNTLNSKPLDEIIKIRKKQVCNGLSFSNNSQDLFWKIYEIIKDDYKDIFFATLTHDNSDYDYKTKKTVNYEYYYRIPNKNRGYFFDFYIKDNKKVIEFDGNYWHHKDKNAEIRDKLKDEDMMNEKIEILHIKELDYIKNSDIIVEQCVNWIKGI